MRYYVTVCTGFEFIAANEIGEQLPGVEALRQEDGRVLFDYGGAPAELLVLRSANHVFAHVGHFDGVPPDAAGLRLLKELGRSLDLAPATAALCQVRDVPVSAPAFRVTANRAGNQEYRSHDVAGALGAGIQVATGWKVDLTGYDIDVCADLSDDRLTVGIRLTAESLHRRNQFAFGRATLKPTIAYGLIRLADPKPGQLLIDPMCGSGTIPIEAGETVPGLRLLAGDIDPVAVGKAHTNRAAVGADFGLFRWNACALPFRDATVDRIVANLPFGVRIGSHKKNPRLYRWFLDEAARVVTPGGRVVFLSLARRLVASLLPRYPQFTCVGRHPVNIGGLVPSAHVVDASAR